MTDQFFKTFDETKDWLDKMGIEDYAIMDDLTVDVDRRVDIVGRKLTHIPVRFGIVGDMFYCENNKLTSLLGAPKKCERLDCSNNKLTDLIGAPVECDVFTCNGNRLTSLAGAPKQCDIFECYANPDLVDITEAPVGCDFGCDHDVVAKNHAAKQLAKLESGAEPNPTTTHPKPARKL